ncbi:MAG: hypothetical protein WCH99_14820 [Verrucomicrobiota bacterium]
MNNLTLTCKDSGDFKPHPEGIHPAVCVDVMDLGLVETDFQGVKKMVNKVKITFESEALSEDGKRCTVFRSFSASLHPKSNLSTFLSKWRGRPVSPGESIELQKLIGACCTLVISHQKNLAGKTYASIDAVSKPTKKVTPSGTYDPAAARQRYSEWKAKQGGGQRPEVGGQNGSATQPSPGLRPAEARLATSPAPASEGNKSGAATTPPGASRTGNDDFDPEVGF